MELIDYLRMLARRWRLLATCTLLGLTLGAVWVLLTPPVYQTSALLFVGNTASSAGNSSNALSASRFTLERMDSYAALVSSPQVTRGVRDQLGLDADLDAIGRRLSADVLGDTVVLSVTARDTRPAMAASVANVAAARLGAVIQLVEAPSTGAPSAIKVTVTRPANAPDAPASPNARLALLLGLVAGLGAGLLAAALRDQALASRASAAAPAPYPPGGAPNGVATAGVAAHAGSPDEGSATLETVAPEAGGAGTGVHEHVSPDQGTTGVDDRYAADPAGPEFARDEVGGTAAAGSGAPETSGAGDAVPTKGRAVRPMPAAGPEQPVGNDAVAARVRP